MPRGVSARARRRTPVLPLMSMITSQLLGAVGEVLPGVVDDVVSPQRADEVELRRAAHAGDLGTERLGDLHGVAAHAARRAGDEDPLPGLHAAGVADGLQGGEPGDRNHGGLLEGEVRRLAGELRLLGDGVLGERAGADPVHLVAGGEPRDSGAYGHDRAGEVEARHPALGGAQPGHEACHAGQAGHEVPGTAIEAGGPDGDEHLAVARGGHVEAARPQDVGCPVGVLDDGAHRRGRNCCRAAPAGRSPASCPSPCDVPY